MQCIRGIAAVVRLVAGPTFEIFSLKISCVVFSFRGTDCVWWHPVRCGFVWNLSICYFSFFDPKLFGSFVLILYNSPHDYKPHGCVCSNNTALFPGLHSCFWGLCSMLPPPMRVGWNTREDDPFEARYAAPFSPTSTVIYGYAFLSPEQSCQWRMCVPLLVRCGAWPEHVVCYPFFCRNQ